MEHTGEEITVLHVDDDPAFGDLVATFLEREGGELGFDVVTMTDARVALDELERGQREIDCVIADYKMPGMNGLDLLRAIRSEWPDLPFLFLTGEGSEEVARDAFREGATDYVQKRSDADHYAIVANRITNAVTQFRARRASRRYGSALETLDSSVFLLDAEGRFVSVDDRFVDRVGTERHALLGSHVSVIDEGGEFEAGFEAVTGETGPETIRFRTTLDTGHIGTQHTVRMTRSTLDAETHGVIGTLSRPAETVDDEVQYLVDFQDVVLDTSTSLMSAEIDEIGTKIRWTLQNVAEFAGLDRCYVFEMDQVGPPTLSHEWTRDGAPPLPDRSEHWHAERWLPNRLYRFENVQVVDTSDLPSGETLAGELFGETTAAVVVPLVSDWELQGFVGFDTSQAPREWADTEVSMFRTIADTIAHTFERQQRERTLRRQNDRLDAFASVVTHDLRNPLSVAKGFVDVAQETGDAANLDRVSMAIDRMESIIEDVLELAREGRTVGTTTSVDLSRIAEEAWLAVETADATLEVDAVEPVSADPDRVPTVFENLFRNSVEHAGDDAAIRVGSLAEGAGFFVEDDGPGIPSTDHVSAFEEGYTTDEEGSGLGLAIVDNVVDAHGWTINLTTGQSGGARFEIYTNGATESSRRLTTQHTRTTD